MRVVWGTGAGGNGIMLGGSVVQIVCMVCLSAVGISSLNCTDSMTRGPLYPLPLDVLIKSV